MTSRSARTQSGGPSRPPQLLRGSLLAILVSAGLGLGCTSIPILPLSGPGSGLNLATAEHVEERTTDLRRQIIGQLETQVEAAVADARAEDKARFEALEASLEAREDEIGEMFKRVENNERDMGELATLMADRLDLLAADAAELREITTDLGIELGLLPFETLEQLMTAIGNHLDARARRYAPPAIEQPPGGQRPPAPPLGGGGEPLTPVRPVSPVGGALPPMAPVQPLGIQPPAPAPTAR